MGRPNVAENEKTDAGDCHCPFCDSSLEMPFPFCQACGAALRYCPVCGQPLAEDVEDCPHCAEQD